MSQIPARIERPSSTYYKDASAIDRNDTGDQRSYGDAGFQVNDPRLGPYTVLAHMYFLTGTTANVGATCIDYCDNPLQVNVAAFIPKRYIHLPLVVKNKARCLILGRITNRE